MITLPGQLAIKTIRGRNGDFNVGRLTTSIGEFVTKNAELDQYREGKYDGDFTIAEIRPSMYTTGGGRMVIELRAVLGGMTLSNIESLTRDEAHQLTPQEIDPIEEEEKEKPRPAPSPPSSAPAEAIPASGAQAPDPLIDTTPFGDEAPADSAAQMVTETEADAALFGTVWPLGNLVKLDPTVSRSVFRQQRNRLNNLGYEFEPLSQEWHLKAA
jgi:Protein of unknown function (DUF3275)